MAYTQGHDGAAGSAVGLSPLLQIFTPEGMADPYPHYAALHERAAVHPSEVGACFVTGYDACRQALSGPAFKVADAAWLDGHQPQWRDHLAMTSLYWGMQSRNLPDHARLRELVAAPFAPRRVAAMGSRVAELADEVLDRLADAAGGGDPVDLVAHAGLALPLAHLGELLGVPEADRMPLRLLILDFFGATELFKTEEILRLADAAAARIRAYCERYAAERRVRPRDDLLTVMTRALDSGRLDEDEFIAVFTFVLGGAGPTSAVVSTAVVELLAHPDQARLLRENPALGDNAAQEAVRYDSPAQIASRVTGADTELAGTRLPAGQLVAVLIGAGNRDPRRFPGPDRYDLTRGGAQVLSFGGGIHYCLGAGLARLYAGVLLPRLFQRFPRLALARTPRRRASLLLRIHDELWVDLKA